MQPQLNGLSNEKEMGAKLCSRDWAATPPGNLEQQLLNLQLTAHAVLAQRTVLYVEDNPAHLDLVEQLIARRTDLKLLAAIDGDRGIQLARVHRPEVILMDIDLPDISGIDALRKLQTDPSTAHIPIIALSANAMPNDIKKSIAMGFFGYITKPLNLTEFMDRLDVALEFSKTGASPRAEA